MHNVLGKTPRMIERYMIRRFHIGCVYAKKLHWAKAASLKTHADRALEHFDDFYGTVYKNRWPALRLALLSEPKYMAIPNTLTGSVDRISASLEDLGAISVHDLWLQFNNMEHESEDQRDIERVKKIEETLVKIANTKKAEEIETLYQNAPWLKKTTPVDTELTDATTENVSRIIKDIREASQEYVTEARLKGAEEFLMESDYYDSYSQANFSIEDLNPAWRYTNRSNFTTLKFPTFIRPYAFEAGNPSMFPSANRDSITGLRDYICINGASITPIIALDLKIGVTFLDMCSGPGTKSLLALMTSCLRSMTCNDMETSRLVRVKRLFTEFTGSDEPPDVYYTRYNAINYTDEEFDRVLVDAPCSQDRTSCTVVDNNIFKPNRLKERLRLVDTQKRALICAFRCLTQKTDSCCVYSTCTLSPIENDGAVGQALNETPTRNLYIDQLGLWNALKPFKQAGLFQMTKTKFGVLIEPTISNNFGPMYVCRIVIKVPETPKEEEVNKTNDNEGNQNQTTS